MELLKLIQQSKITCIAYVNKWENLVNLHLEKLNNINYLTGQGKTLGEIVEDLTNKSNIRDLKISDLFNENVYYIIDLNDIKFPDTYNAPANNSQYVRDRLRELSSKIYNIESRNVSLIILAPSYYKNDVLDTKYGHGTLYISELVITFGDTDVEITKNMVMSNTLTSENIIEYSREFYLNQIL